MLIFIYGTISRLIDDIYALADIEMLLLRNLRSFYDFPTLPQPHMSLIHEQQNRLIDDELIMTNII